MTVIAANRLDALLYPHQRRLVVPLGEDQAERNGVLSNSTGFPALTFPGGFSPPTADAPIRPSQAIVERPDAPSAAVELVQVAVRPPADELPVEKYLGAGHVGGNAQRADLRRCFHGRGSGFGRGLDRASALPAARGAEALLDDARVVGDERARSMGASVDENDCQKKGELQRRWYWYRSSRRLMPGLGFR